jgi:transcriptional regulator with XRE-family HTH domain
MSVDREAAQGWIEWFSEPLVIVDSLAHQFGAVLRRRRETAGLSQEALAARSGLHRTTISLLERGQRTPSIDVVQKLARALGTTMASLVGELESEQIDPSS